MACFELVPGRRIGRNEPCFIIAEVGQNHQGDIKIAKKLISAAKDCGADCVKFQKSDMKSKFNQAALDRPYNSPHSWGATYGDHKKHLEFSKEQFIELQRYAYEVGISFTASGMDQVSMDFLNSINVPFFKVGSGDANNLPLLVHTAKLGKPLVVSTGMQSISTVCDTFNAILPLNQRLCILQCTSTYPTPAEHVHLKVIKASNS